MSRIAPSPVTGPVKVNAAGTFRWIIGTGIVLVVGAFFLWGLVSILRPSTGIPTRQVAQQAPAPQVAAPARTDSQCQGDLETVLLGPQWTVINPGGRCAVNFDTMAGVALIGEPSNYVEDKPGANVGNVLRTKSVRVIQAKAKEGQARLNYMKCPHGTTVPGQFACNLSQADSSRFIGVGIRY